MLRLLTLLCLLLPATAMAVPQLITYSGRILDEVGDPIEGEVVISVGLFDQVTDPTTEIGLGAEVWSDDFVVIAINGYFSVVLGSQTVLSSANLDSSTLYVTLAVDSGPWMVPASEMTSAAFALRAESAETADVADVALAVEEGPVAATEVTVNGETVIDQTGAWTGAIETTQAAKVGSLWVDGVLILDGNNWVGPAPNLPAGTQIDGSSPLLETELADASTSLGVYVDDTVIGVTDNANTKNHERFTKDDLLMEITGAASVNTIPAVADEYLYHPPTSAADVTADLADTFLGTQGDTSEGELILGAGGDVRGQNSSDPANITPGTVMFSLAPSPSETDPTDTWEIEAESGSFLLKDHQDTSDEYLLIEEDSAGLGTFRFKPNGHEATTIQAELFTVSPDNSGVTNVIEVTPDSVALLAAPIGNVLEVSETSLNGQYQVQANLGGKTLLDVQEDAVGIGASGVGVTVVDGLTVNGTVSFNGGQTLGGDQIVEGTLVIDPDVGVDDPELEVAADGVTVREGLTVSGGAGVTGDLGVVGNLDVGDGVNTLIQSTGSTLSTTLDLQVDADGDGINELAVSDNEVSLAADFVVDVNDDNTDQFSVDADGVAFGAGNLVADANADGIAMLTLNEAGTIAADAQVVVSTGGVDINAGGLTVAGASTFESGGVTVTSGGVTVTSGGLTVNTDTGIDVNAGGIVVDGGGIDVNSGGVTVDGGSLAVNAGTADIDVGLQVDPNNDNTQELEVTSSAVDANVRITADGGISMAGISYVDGTLLRNACPSDMDAIDDSWTNKVCIDKTYTDTGSTWNNAMNSCGGAGKQLCEVWQLAYCDGSSDCEANAPGQLDRDGNTDIGADAGFTNNAEFWTRTSRGGSSPVDAQQFMTYDVRAPNNDLLDDLVPVFSNGINTYYFYCCLDAL